MSACRSCGAPVRWVRTTSGRTMPLDPDPRGDGNIEYTGAKAQTRAGSTVPVVRYVTGAQLSLDAVDATPRYVSHFATCPDADEWRNPDG